jgi:hypothetical protein
MISFWDNYATRCLEFSDKISISGMGMLMAIHGAVAVGAIKIVADKNAPPALINTARFAILAGIVGIALLGIGKLVIFESLTKLGHKIKYDNMVGRKYRRYRAMFV